MRFEGTLDIAAPRDRVWSFLTDPTQVTTCAPDVQSLEVADPHHFKVVVRAGVGPDRTPAAAKQTRGYTDIGGHQPWFADAGGTRDPLLILHGGLSDSELLLARLGPSLGERFRVLAFDRRGHGRTADTAAPFHYDDMATEAIAAIDKLVGGPANLVGWSDGGNAALLVALRRPDP